MNTIDKKGANGIICAFLFLFNTIAIRLRIVEKKIRISMPGYPINKPIEVISFISPSPNEPLEKKYPKTKIANPTTAPKKHSSTILQRIYVNEYKNKKVFIQFGILRKIISVKEIIININTIGKIIV